MMVMVWVVVVVKHGGNGDDGWSTESHVSKGFGS